MLRTSAFLRFLLPSKLPALKNVGIQEARAYAIMAVREYVLWGVVLWIGMI